MSAVGSGNGKSASVAVTKGSGTGENFTFCSEDANHGGVHMIAMRSLSWSVRARGKRMKNDRVALHVLPIRLDTLLVEQRQCENTVYGRGEVRRRDDTVLALRLVADVPLPVRHDAVRGALVIACGTIAGEKKTWECVRNSVSCSSCMFAEKAELHVSKIV